MSMKNGVWHDAETDPPGAEYMNRPVLTARKFEYSKNDFYWKYDFAIFNGESPEERVWNKRHVAYWMPLPKMPVEK